jgi:hypothetical protein
MDLSYKNLLDVYEYHENNFYLYKHFMDTNRIGSNVINSEDPYKVRHKGNVSGIHLVDKENSYHINELALRGKINYESEILGAGCSFTFGMGVPEEGIWTQILGKKINKDIINLSSPGWSTKKICDQIIIFCAKYKMPKTIFALFPGFFRGMMVEDIDFYSTTKNMNPKEQHKIPGSNIPLLMQQSFDPMIYSDKRNNFIAFEHIKKSDYFEPKHENITYMENVLSPHQLILDAVDSIYLLEYFCKSHNIDLQWSTWHKPTTLLMKNLLKIPNFKLKKYIEFSDDNDNYLLENINNFPHKSCSIGHSSSLIKHPCWNKGSDHIIDINDNKLPGWPGHPGIHYQIHLAEFFYKIYEDNI